MADEAFVDELNEEIDESNGEEGSYEEEESTETVRAAYEAKLADMQKENERLAKYEARYKSNKKAEQSKPIASDASTIDAVIESKLQEIADKNSFKTTYGDDVFNDVASIREKHPSLSWEEAKSLSPVYNDPARNSNPEGYSSPWRAKLDTTTKYITQEEWSRLPQKEWNIMDDKIARGEIVLKG